MREFQDGRLWVFAGWECDELRREMRQGNVPADIEPKPFDVLIELLEQYPNVVRKEELLEAVWGESNVVEASLTTAISKLRKVLGPEGQNVIETVHGIGYKIATPVEVKTVPRHGETTFRFAPGDSLRGREHWRLTRRLGPEGHGEVWLVTHSKTQQQRVFKFAADGVLLRNLKREATLFRYLEKSLGRRAEFVRVLDWNFESLPFFLEMEYGGVNLQDWGEAREGLATVPLKTRVEILADIARAVSLAHDVGVLHKDLKPANVLISPTGASGREVRIVDFGSGGLLEPARLGAYEITQSDFTRTEGISDSDSSATLMYLAPEVLRGQPFTASCDVYALGVMLYQLAIGNFRKMPMPGWEQDIADPLLREDIAAAASGDPQQRLGSAALLAVRLSTLDARRTERNERILASERSREAEDQLRRARARRPWLLLVGCLLLLGFAVTFTLYLSATRERLRANHEAAISESINRFLAEDLLGRADPFRAGKHEETLVDAVKQAASGIGRQFKNDPLIAARLYHTIARALARRDESAIASEEFERSAGLFVQAEGANSPSAIRERLEGSIARVRTFDPSALATARKIVAEQERRIATLPHQAPDLRAWLWIAQGILAYHQGDMQPAAREFQRALDAGPGSSSLDEAMLLTIKHSLAAALMRLGEENRAESLVTELEVAYARRYGEESPAALQVRLLAAQIHMNQGKHDAVVRETASLYPKFVKAFGEEHGLTMQVLATKASSEASLELWDDAVRDDLRARELALRAKGPAHVMAIVPLSDAGLCQCRAGRFREGTINTRAAFESARTTFGPKASLTGATAYALASCLLEEGQTEESGRLLASIDAAAVAELTGDPGWYANIALAQARIAYQRQDYPAARTYLGTASRVFELPNAEPYQKRKLTVLRTALGGRR